MDPASFFYEVYLACALFVLLVAWQIRRSRFGAGLLSIREDEDTARMLGVPTERYKQVAFVVTGLFQEFSETFRPANRMGMQA